MRTTYLCASSIMLFTIVMYRYCTGAPADQNVIGRGCNYSDHIVLQARLFCTASRHAPLRQVSAHFILPDMEC